MLGGGSLSYPVFPSNLTHLWGKKRTHLDTLFPLCLTLFCTFLTRVNLLTGFYVYYEQTYITSKHWHQLLFLTSNPSITIFCNFTLSQPS